MSHNVLSYEDLKQELIEEIKKRQFMVLATSKENKVMARTVGVIPDGLSVFFIMRPATRKYTQIVANPQVAVAMGNLQIEGVVKSRGHPLANGNSFLMEIWRNTNLKMYDYATRGYSQRPELEIFEVAPRRIALYKNPFFDDVQEPYWDILYVDREEAYRVKTKDAENAPVYRL